MHISIPECHWSVLKLVEGLYTLVEFFIIRKLRFIQWKPSKFCIKLHIQKNGNADYYSGCLAFQSGQCIAVS